MIQPILTISGLWNILFYYLKITLPKLSKVIGAIAKPKQIIFTPDLPKTRSGKIIRRALRSLAQGKDVGDTTTLANPDIIDIIQKTIEKET